MANKRIYFAIQGLAIKPEPIGAAVSTWEHGDVVNCVQSVAVTTTFNLEQAFELGQIQIYENIEGLPDVEVTMESTKDKKQIKEKYNIVLMSVGRKPNTE